MACQWVNVAPFVAYPAPFVAYVAPFVAYKLISNCNYLYIQAMNYRTLEQEKLRPFFG